MMVAVDANGSSGSCSHLSSGGRMRDQYITVGHAPQFFHGIMVEFGGLEGSIAAHTGRDWSAEKVEAFDDDPMTCEICAV